MSRTEKTSRQATGKIKFRRRVEGYQDGGAYHARLAEIVEREKDGNKYLTMWFVRVDGGVNSRVPLFCLTDGEDEILQNAVEALLGSEIIPGFEVDLESLLGRECIVTVFRNGSRFKVAQCDPVIEVPERPVAHSPRFPQAPVAAPPAVASMALQVPSMTPSPSAPLPPTPLWVPGNSGEEC